MCLSVCMSVCPAFTVYISLTMGRILINLGENVRTLVWLIVLKFHKNQFSVDVIMTSFLFFFKLFPSCSTQRETTVCKGKQLCCSRLWLKGQRSCCIVMLSLASSGFVSEYSTPSGIKNEVLQPCWHNERWFDSNVPIFCPLPIQCKALCHRTGSIIIIVLVLRFCVKIRWVISLVSWLFDYLIFQLFDLRDTKTIHY